MDKPLKHSTVTSLALMECFAFLGLIALAIILIGS